MFTANYTTTTTTTTTTATTTSSSSTTTSTTSSSTTTTTTATTATATFVTKPLPLSHSEIFAFSAAPLISQPIVIPPIVLQVTD